MAKSMAMRSQMRYKKNLPPKDVKKATGKVKSMGALLAKCK